VELDTNRGQQQGRAVQIHLLTHWFPLVVAEVVHMIIKLHKTEVLVVALVAEILVLALQELVPLVKDTLVERSPMVERIQVLAAAVQVVSVQTG
jgi:hypothetical protein